METLPCRLLLKPKGQGFLCSAADRPHLKTLCRSPERRSSYPCSCLFFMGAMDEFPLCPFVF